jgi:ABC-type transport system involved in multi-copper enzyme maturation permease subunit
MKDKLMWHTLIIKEIKQTFLETSSVVLALLCLLLVPLALYVGTKDYESHRQSYLSEYQDYRSRNEKDVGAHVEVHGFRPPAPLSIFCGGVTPLIPDKVVTSRSGLYRSIKETNTDNPHALLLGKVDYTYCLTYVVSLAALIFTFGCISMEKESGSLSLITANSIPRSVLLLSKVTGRYIAFIVPLLLSITLGLVIINHSPLISVFSVRMMTIIGVIVCVSLLFVLCLMCLGICVSTWTHYSINSMVVVFLVWTVMILAIPKLSPRIARALYPIDSSTTFRIKRTMLAEDQDNAFVKAREALLEACFAECGAPDEDMRRMPTQTDEGKRAVQLYDERIVPLSEDHLRQKANILKQLDQDYMNQKRAQNRLALGLARLSPVTCFICTVSELCKTGMHELDNFNDNAQRFQDQVKKAIYDQFILRELKGVTMHIYPEGFNRDLIKVPEMSYRYPRLAQSLERVGFDILLLAFYMVLFCGVGLIKMNRYDVR